MHSDVEVPLHHPKSRMPGIIGEMSWALLDLVSPPSNPLFLRSDHVKRVVDVHRKGMRFSNQLPRHGL